MSLKATRLATNVVTHFVSILEVPYDDMTHTQRVAARGFVLLCAYFVFSLTPAAFVTFFYLLISPTSWGAFRASLALVCLSEILFYAYYRFQLAEASKHRPAIHLTFEERITLAQKIVAHIEDVFETLNNWLHQQPTGELCFRQYSTWLIYAFFDKASENLTAEENSQTEKILGFFENHLDFPSPPTEGEYVDYAPVRPTIEPLRVIHKPLIFYTVNLV